MDKGESRVVEARLKLRDRWRAKPRPETEIRGTGPTNRHGMPQLPPGQKRTQKWPVLDLGRKPNITQEEWRLVLDGLCEHPQNLTWQDFQNLPQCQDVSDFHCVTGWSKMDIAWQGVRLSDLVHKVGLKPEATHVVCYGYDGYTTNLPLEEALKPDVLLVHSADGRALTREHGGPVRMITPQLYAWKGTKWICRLEFVAQDRPGFWEQNGYSNTAHPWQEDRYAEEASSRLGNHRAAGWLAWFILTAAALSLTRIYGLPPMLPLTLSALALILMLQR